MGAFHRPKKLFHCPEFLETLPQRELASGLGEVAKYCFLDKAIHALVMKKSPLERIIQACLHYKKRVTQKDFYGLGERKKLNLGHSFGHAFESIYSLPHGTAVLWGLKALFTVMGRTSLLKEWETLRAVLGLDGRPPWNGPCPVKELVAFLERDKKKKKRHGP